VTARALEGGSEGEMSTIEKLQRTAPTVRSLHRDMGALRRDLDGRNETPASTTGKDTHLFKKSRGQESGLGFLGHTLMENPNGLSAASRFRPA
jgi:hypothetical protein